MSRHYFDGDHKGKKARVILGYDRALDEYYMMLEQLTVQGHATGTYLYASIADVDNRLFDLDYFAGKLEALGINAPASIFEAVWADALDKRGNYVVEHFADGTRRVVYDESAARTTAKTSGTPS